LERPHISKITRAKLTGGVAEVVEHLLEFNPQSQQKEKENFILSKMSQGKILYGPTCVKYLE
jgi:hypothetical protein